MQYTNIKRPLALVFHQFGSDFGGGSWAWRGYWEGWLFVSEVTLWILFFRCFTFCFTGIVLNLLCCFFNKLDV